MENIYEVYLLHKFLLSCYTDLWRFLPGIKGKEETVGEVSVGWNYCKLFHTIPIITAEEINY